MSGWMDGWMDVNSATHGILNAHKYKNIKNPLFLGSDKPRMIYFSCS